MTGRDGGEGARSYFIWQNCYCIYALQYKSIVGFIQGLEYLECAWLRMYFLNLLMNLSIYTCILMASTMCENV